jgi:methylated-DNA-[protein]-cysteine S-methyltransferase
MFSSTYTSPLGVIHLESDGASLTGLYLPGQKSGPFPEEGPQSAFAQAKDWLDRYFAGKKPAIDELDLAPAGSEFRQGVWALMRDIPYGAVSTYGAIAKAMAARMGKARMSAQAVGGAVGSNPISIIIPCHRVVGTNGSLTGYGGGLHLKVRLLELEGVDMSREALKNAIERFSACP